MLYPKAKILSESEFEALKKADVERSSRHSCVTVQERQNYYSIHRKVTQRTLNSHVRRCNRIIENDYLWRGRFFIRQVRADFHKFDDGSGGELFVTLRFYDKKTMKYIDSFGTASDFCFGWGSVYWLMNKAITEIFDVWKKDREDPDGPYQDRVDYMSIPNDWVVEFSSPLYEEYNYFAH